MKFILTLFLFLTAQAGIGQVDVTLNADNMIFLEEPFYFRSTSNLVQKAKEMDTRLPKGHPLYLVLDTPGGLISAGLNLIDTLKTLNRPVHTVTLFAASMGFQTVQGLGDRLILPFGTLMAHKARGGFFGEFPGQLDSRYSWYLKRMLALDEITVARTKGKHTLESYRNLYENEYWCDGQDCVDQGFADRVITARCDESLNGTREQLWDRFFYQGRKIEIIDTKSNCPLILGFLDYKILVDGTPLWTLAEQTNSRFYETISGEDLEKIKAEVDKKVEERKANKVNRKVQKSY